VRQKVTQYKDLKTLLKCELVTDEDPKTAQLIHDTKPKGINFTFKNWYHYLMKLRYHAKMIGVSARTVEWTLFRYHQNDPARSPLQLG